MANETEKKSSGSTVLFKIILGAAIMVGGGYLNSIQAFASIEKPLEEQRIPLQLGVTISVIGVLIMMFPLVELFFLNPLKEAINARNSELENTFSEVEGLRREMGDMKNAYEKRIVDTEADAREKIQAQIREAQDLGAQLRADAVTVKEQMIAQAQEEISREKDKIMNELRIEVVNLTLGATEKILGESVSNDANRRLITEFIEKAEVPGR